MIKRQFSRDDYEEIRQQLSLLNGDPDMEAIIISYLLLQHQIDLHEAWQLMDEDDDAIKRTLTAARCLR